MLPRRNSYPQTDRSIGWRALYVATIVFYLPMEVLRYGLRGALDLAFREYRVVCGMDSLSEEDSIELTCEEGDVRIHFLTLDSYDGLLIHVKYYPALRPNSCCELVFWSGDRPPMNEAERDRAEKLGLPHAPRPIERSSNYVNALVMSDNLRNRIQAVLDHLGACHSSSA